MKESTGVVVKAKMQNAVLVRLERKVQHPLLKKYILKRTKVMARDALKCQEGDLVAIVQTRPLSKMIRWRVVRKIGFRAKPEAVDEVPA